jgi:endonuclease/exonuclease/phosphatase family metal-dependent hydrolase
VFLLLTSVAQAETITVATYNVERFNEHFLARHLQQRAATQPVPAELKEMWKEAIDQLKKSEDEDNWEVSRVVLDPKFAPDILVIEEGARQDDLEYFNKRWLNGAYETVVQFPSNTERDQHLDMMLKAGFKIVEKRDQYYTEPDPAGANERGNRLFARGPSFALIQTPGGFKLWVGVTHQKSKSGNSVDVTKWRLREAKRTHEIIKELASSSGVGRVMLLGDMNDEFGFQEFEQEAGGDVIAALIGPPEDGFTLATKPLVDQGQISFGGYWNGRHRSFIDHVIVTKELAPLVHDARVFQNDIASVASDHYPVSVKVDSSK